MLRKDIELAHFYRSRRITFIMFYFDEFFLFLCTVLNAFMLYSISFQFFSSILFEQYLPHCCRHMANNNLKTIRLQKLGFPTLVQIESQRPSKEHYHCHYLFFFPSNNIQHSIQCEHRFTPSQHPFDMDLMDEEHLFWQEFYWGVLAANYIVQIVCPFILLFSLSDYTRLLVAVAAATH